MKIVEHSSTLSCSLDSTQTHWGTKAQPKPSQEVLGEGGGEGVQVFQGVVQWIHSVEGHSALRLVDIHCYSGRASGEHRDGCYSVVVPGWVMFIIAVKTPGLGVPPQPAVISSFPLHVSAGHCYINLSSPLYLQVAVGRERLTTQHLGPEVKSLWVIRIELLLSHRGHLPVVLRQQESAPCCVWVQSELAAIWQENRTWLGPDTVYTFNDLAITRAM